MKDQEVGFVVEARQYVLTLRGLPSAHVHDIIVHESGQRAVVRSLAEDHLTALLLDPGAPRTGDRYTLLPDNRLYTLGENLFGRTINVLGEPMDGGEAFGPGNAAFDLDIEAPGIDVRIPITDMLKTGVTLVDTLVPIARGQRQLFFGAVPGGKADLLADIVLNQKPYGTICVYTIIGKSLSELERIQRRVLQAKDTGAVILLAALSDQPSARISIAPAVAFLIASHFQKQGKNVLVILDDLDVHAKYLREIALLEGRLPGRESYPGDLFYEHAHLLERSGCFTSEFGGGSITSLPVIQTDPTASLGIVSTNLMSTTDGHFAFVSELEHEGVYPAISEEQSITRIGRYAQGLLQKQLSWQVRMTFSNGRRQRQYAAFGAPLGKAALEVLHQTDILDVLIRQEPLERIPSEIQVPLLALAFTPFLTARDRTFAEKNKAQLVKGIAEKSELEELRSLALSNEMQLTDYLKKVQTQQPVFESLCRT